MVRCMHLGLRGGWEGGAVGYGSVGVVGDTDLEKGVEGGGTRWTRIVRDLGCVLVATMSARPPPPLLPGMLHGGGVGGLKKKSTKSSGRSVPDVSKAIVRYLKGRRSELLEQDQENATVQSALETMDRHLAEWGVLAESVDSGAGGSQKRFNLVQVEDHSWGFDHNNAVPIPCEEFATLDWSQAQSIGKSAEGTEGVFFVKFPRNRAVVVKGPSTVGGELYGTVLAKRLGVATPSLRLVHRNSDEGQKLIAALSGLDKRVQGGLSRPFLFIMEYVQGVPLADVIAGTPGATGKEGSRWTDDTFGTTTKSGSLALHTVGTENLLQLGRMVGLDFIMNNFDRFPVVWANNGNPDNVMFYGSCDGDDAGDNALHARMMHRVVAIDNMASCISKEKFEKEYTAYKTKAASVLAALFAEPECVNESFSNIRTFLQFGHPNGGPKGQAGGWPGLGIDIGDAGVLLTQQGFLECLAAVGDMEKTELHELKRSIHDILKESLTPNFTYGLERIDPEFIVDIASAMYDAVAGDLDKLEAATEGEDDAVLQPPIFAPALELIPDKGDTEHRRMEERQRQETDIRSLNAILGSSTIWGKPFRRAQTSAASSDGKVLKPEKFVSPRNRRAINSKMQSGVCVLQ